MNNTRVLQDIGLTEKESQIYLTLLGVEKADVGEIAKISKLKRPTIYIILEELRKKGLVLKIPYAKKAVFMAQDPDKFFDESFEKVKSAYNSLGELKALQKKNDKVSIKYFEGEEGVKEALFYRYQELENSEIVGFFAKGDTISPKLMATSHRWRESMNKMRVKVRAIAPKHVSLKEFRDTDSKLNQIFKTVPLGEYSSDVSIHATDLFVCITLFNVQQAIIIENPAIVKTIREIFEISWKNSK
jgi:HTH-type transcriptional regulator, sugar sensing transcriptional regulator